MNNWNKLKASDKHQLMQIYISSGVRNLNDIRKHYNTFEDGGILNSEDMTLPKNIEYKRDELRNSFYKAIFSDRFKNDTDINNALLKSRDAVAWTDNWYNKRRDKELAYSSEEAIELKNKRMKSVEIDNKTYFSGLFKGLPDGSYYPKEHKINIYGNQPEDIKVHELVHARGDDEYHRRNFLGGVKDRGVTNNKGNVGKVSNILLNSKDEFGVNRYYNKFGDNISGQVDYINSPEEIYSRIMQLRYKAKWNPEDYITNDMINSDEIQSLLKELHLDYIDDDSMEQILNDVAMHNIDKNNLIHQA